MKKATIALLAAGILTVPTFGATIPTPEEVYNSDIYSMGHSELLGEYENLYYQYQILYEEYDALMWQQSEEGQAARNAMQDSSSAPASTAKSIWTADYYKDQFNNSTGRAYIINTEPFKGTFSNSAVTDRDDFKAYVYSEPDSVSFTLLEYGDTVVKGDWSDGESYSINVLTPSGESVAMQGMLYDGASGITLGEYSQRFNDILKEEGEVRVSMVSNKISTTKYFFVIPAAEGFSELYAETFS